MIQSFKEIPGSDLVLFHSFSAFAPSPGPSLASTRPARVVPSIPGNVDVNDVYAGNPQPDFGNDAGASYCSLYSLCRAAGQPESGFARDQVAKGSIKPDATLNGVAHWTAGDSANGAARTLKKNFAAAQAAKKNPMGSIGQLGKPLNSL